jgi:uncharacterized cofD-like protein
VTVGDDGGSSGRLRTQFNIPPPGDIRNCLVALADAEPLMGDLFQFRFKESGELEGHSFGNLFILAMLKITGDFEKAIREASKILAIRGRVVPSTVKIVTLVARHRDGSVTTGESNISKSRKPIERLTLRPAGCSAAADALEAIRSADGIVVGPGSLYTSILPNLLIEDLAGAMAGTSAPKIYVCNVMTQPHETDDFSAFDHVNTLIEHTRPEVLSHVIVNTGQVPKDMLIKYEKEEAYPVAADLAKIRSLGYEVVEDNIVTFGDMVRHNPRRVSRIVLEIVNDAKRKAAASKRQKRLVHANSH